MMAKWLRILPFFMVVFICRRIKPGIVYDRGTAWHYAYKDVLIKCRDK